MILFTKCAQVEQLEVLAKGKVLASIEYRCMHEKLLLSVKICA
jgi:hypothetical protein